MVVVEDEGDFVFAHEKHAVVVGLRLGPFGECHVLAKNCLELYERFASDFGQGLPYQEERLRKDLREAWKKRASERRNSRHEITV